MLVSNFLFEISLRSAIGPDKEMPIYDFEKLLRKDYRWQYTDNARRDVSNAIRLIYSNRIKASLLIPEMI